MKSRCPVRWENWGYEDLILNHVKGTCWVEKLRFDAGIS